MTMLKVCALQGAGYEQSPLESALEVFKTLRVKPLSILV